MLFLDYDPNFEEMLWDIIKYPDSINSVSITIELTTLAILLMLFYHGVKKYGWQRVLLYFLGGFTLTALEENFMVTVGYFENMPLHSTKTYYYNMHSYILWVGAVPLVVMMAWFILTYSSYHIVESVIPTDKRRWLFKRVLLAGMLGTTIDFILDPIVIRRHGWIWLTELEETFWFLQVHVTNFLGFFLLVASFNYFFVWYWERFIPKRKKWPPAVRVIVYFVMVFIPILFVVAVIIIVVILQAILGLNGIDISWWEWLN